MTSLVSGTTTELYEIMERNIKTMKNPSGSFIYDLEPTLINRGLLLKRDISRAGYPLVIIKMVGEEGEVSTFTQYRAEETVDALGEVTHTPADPENPGSSIATVAGTEEENAWGNWEWKLTIVEGGTVGNAGITYTLSHRSHNWQAGTYGAPQALPGGEVGLDGKVAIGEGIELTFSAGTLVAGDTYIFESKAHVIHYTGKRAFRLPFEVRMLLSEAGEDFPHWADESLQAFIDHEQSNEDGTQIFKQQITPPREQEIFTEDERGKGQLERVDMVFTVSYSGEIWLADYAPLGRVLDWSVQPINDIDSDL